MSLKAYSLTCVLNDMSLTCVLSGYMFWWNISASGCVPPGTSAQWNKSVMTLASVIM